jgi:ABC-type multidrug transport system ATPase subunit
VNHPPLLLADEPTGNLDPETSIGIMQLIYRINRTGTTVVVATHDREMVDKMRRRVIELSEGRVIRDDESGFYRPDESTAEFAMNLREEMGYGKETVIRTKPNHPVIDRDEVISKARRFTEQDRDRYSEEKVRRALYGEEV